MKDKTDAMNRGYSTEEAEAGYSIAGKPTSTHSDKRRKLGMGDLLDTKLDEVENLTSSGHGAGGFLKRNNFSDRF